VSQVSTLAACPALRRKIRTGVLSVSALADSFLWDRLNSFLEDFEMLQPHCIDTQPAIAGS
jgi:predicted dinucleotide-utilizing enzyme